MGSLCAFGRFHPFRGPGCSSLQLSFTVEPKSNDSSLSSSAVIMPGVTPETADSVSGHAIAGQSPSVSVVEDDDTDSVISMSTNSSFIDVEEVTTATVTATSEDQRERDEFDFVEETEERYANEVCLL